MSEIKPSKRVTDAIAAYEAHIAGDRDRAARVQARSAELVQELPAAEAELQAAMDATIKDPTAENEHNEAEARRKVAEMRLQISGSEERAARAFNLGSQEREQLAGEARRIAKAEAEAIFDEEYPKRLKAIADAKYAYLDALRGMHRFLNEVNEIHYGTQRVTGSTAPGKIPDHPKFWGIKPNFNYRQGERQVHGISASEMNDAFDRGIIRMRSVEEGRQYDAQ